MTVVFNMNRKVFDLKLSEISKLKKFNNIDWVNVLNYLPSVLNGKLTIKPETLQNIQKDSDPAGKAIDFMSAKAVTLSELYFAFDKLKIEQGLLFFNKPYEEIRIVRRPENIVQVNCGKDIFVECLADAFPYPTYEYFKNGIKISEDGSVFLKKSATKQDSGDYKCVITQIRDNNDRRVQEIEFKIQVDSDSLDDLEKRLKIDIHPAKQSVNIGATCQISAHVNEFDLSKIEFTWFKFNEITEQDEAILNIASAKEKNLVIENFSVEDIGNYRCLVTRESTSEKVLSQNYSSIFAEKISQYELKIALLIGNSNYENTCEEIMKCKKCKDPSYNLTNLNLVELFEKLKLLLESLGYLVIAFIDLEAESFLRALRTTRKICDAAKSVSLLVYVAGHGYNAYNEDYLIPIDASYLLHRNHHNFRGIHNSLSLCSLSNLLDNFRPVSNISIVCFWDLCRREWIDYLNEYDHSITDNLKFSILFCCKVGKSGYELPTDAPQIGFRRGPIFLNLLIKHLKPNRTLYEVAVNMNAEIQHLRMNYQIFSNLSDFRLHSTLEKLDLSEPANSNKSFEQCIKQFYLDNESSRIDYFPDNKKRPIFKYKFLSDTFVNSLILEIESFGNDFNGLDFDLEFSNPIQIASMVNLNIKLIIRNSLGNSMSLNIVIPEIAGKLSETMYSEEINSYVEEKKKIDLNNDAYSITSYEMESESLETTSTDE